MVVVEGTEGAEGVTVGRATAIDSGPPTDVLLSKQNSTSDHRRTELLRICQVEFVVVLS